MALLYEWDFQLQNYQRDFTDHFLTPFLGIYLTHVCHNTAPVILLRWSLFQVKFLATIRESSSVYLFCPIYVTFKSISGFAKSTKIKNFSYPHEQDLTLTLTMSTMTSSCSVVTLVDPNRTRPGLERKWRYPKRKWKRKYQWNQPRESGRNSRKLGSGRKWLQGAPP